MNHWLDLFTGTTWRKFLQAGGTVSGFPSHSGRDKAVLRSPPERLRQGAPKVWLDESVLKPGNSVPAKIEQELEHSHALVPCTSTNAFGSGRARLETQTSRPHDPLNKRHRSIPLRLDDAPTNGA